MKICENLRKHLLFSTFIVRILYVIYIKYEICINQLFMLSIRLPVNSQLFVKLCVDFQLCRSSVLLTPMLFKGQLCLQWKELNNDIDGGI